MQRLRKLWSSTTVKILLAVLLVLIGIRAVLPIVVERYANRTLDHLEGYSGHIEDVDLALWRGAYVIEGIRIVKTGGKVPVPFFSASEVDLSVQWAALFEGSIVAEIDVENPKLNFVLASEEPKQKQATQSQVEPASNWTDVVKDLTPFNINRFSINNGEVHFRDFSSEPKVDVFVQDIYAEARNLTNSKDQGGSLVADFDARARAMHSGRVQFDGKVDPYAKQPTFDTSFKLDGLELKQLNSYLRAYANVDAEKGTLSIDAEFAAKNGGFKGYVKPFIKDLDVLRWKEKDSLPNKIWQGIVEVAAELFQNQPKDQTALKIPFEGRLDNPNVDVWSALGSLLKNAFIEALQRGFEGKVDIEKVRGKDQDLKDSDGKDSDGKDSDGKDSDGKDSDSKR